MNIVICTSVGVVTVAGLVALVGALSWNLAKLINKMEEVVTFPERLKNALGILLVVSLVGVLLFASHEVGCKVIHLTMRH